MKEQYELSDKYEIVRQIGKGGMSKVYLARDRRLGKCWAIKEAYKEGERGGAIYISGAVAEANLLKKMDHPALPRIVDILENQKCIYVVMDYIEGETLSAAMPREGFYSEDKVIGFAGELVDVLGYLHGQVPPVIYRDIKPDNIMITQEGRLKLIDFGIAREYKNGGNGDTMCLGTRGYAAPEQFGGKGQSDERTDIYCLGVTLHYLLTGQDPAKPPYKLKPIRQLRPEISSGLERVIIKCTQADPRERYQSVYELASDLENYKKLDKSFERKEKARLAVYRLSQCMFLLTFMMAVIFTLKARNAYAGAYEEYLYKCETALDDQESMKYLRCAMELRPEETGNYTHYMELCRSDGVFSKDEESYLINQVEQFGEGIEDIYLVNYGIACLYWYYYEAEDTRIASSIPWFKRTLLSENVTDEDIMRRAEVYKNLGSFYKEIAIQMEENVPEGSYAEYIKNFEEEICFLEAEENEMIISLSLEYGLEVITNYIFRIKSEGITREQLCNDLAAIENKINNLNTVDNLKLKSLLTKAKLIVEEAYD